MTKPSTKLVRCAIYTRVSTDNGLDQEFNSLDAQHEAASAYIKSQAHAGWSLVRFRYDDGGYSGGSTDRPALQKLLDDIRAHKVDIVVVYKVDRLTRSLADFAKLVELFDAHGVSFVSVTQQFNTTTSMGRLTLNVLLSFAQFEREVTSERIRDKIAASKRKGLWVGGPLPLGYELKAGKLTIIEEEAERVRAIFCCYLKAGSLKLTLADLMARDIRTKVRHLSTGRTIGGIHFTRGPLAYLLRNRFYVGEVPYKGEILPGEQPPILDKAVFDAVQGQLDCQRANSVRTRSPSGSWLAGLIFNDRGHPMTPTHAVKNGVRYRYYVSKPSTDGHPEQANTCRRVPAAEIEELVLANVRQHLGLEPPSAAGADCPGKTVMRIVNSGSEVELLNGQRTQSPALPVLHYIDRVQILDGRIKVHLSRKRRREAEVDDGVDPSTSDIIVIPWTKTSGRCARQILLPASRSSAQPPRPIRSETRTRLVKAIARARRWLTELTSGRVTDLAQIAARERCSVRQVQLTLSLAFLAPGLVEAALSGRLPHGIGLTTLRDPPAGWSLQMDQLGLAR